MNRKKLIEDIANKIVDDFYEMQEYEIDGDEYGLDSISVNITFDVGKCQVEGYYWYDRRREESQGVEVNLYSDKDHELLNVNDAIENRVKELFDLGDYKDAVLEKAKEDSMDEWQRNGFASESDYYHWRYS